MKPELNPLTVAAVASAAVLSLIRPPDPSLERSFYSTAPARNEPGRTSNCANLGDVTSVPLIDLGALEAAGGAATVGRMIDAACRDTGFFVIVGHGIDPALLQSLDACSRLFFALPEAAK